jgi:hypothetical protein
VTIAYALGAPGDPTGIAVFVRTGDTTARLVLLERGVFRSLGAALTALADHAAKERIPVQVTDPTDGTMTVMQADVVLLVDVTEWGDRAAVTIGEAGIDARVQVVRTEGEDARPQADLIADLRTVLDAGHLTIAEGIAATPALLASLDAAGRKRWFRSTVEATDLRAVDPNAAELLAVAIGAQEATGIRGEFKALPTETIAWLEEVYGGV